MPVDFLTDEQANKYGKFSGEPTPEQLARFFHLDDTDRSHVLKRRGDHNRLGFAIQLCTVRFLGTFLVQPVDVPENVIAFLAKQLNIGDTSGLPQYLDRRTTRHEHANGIKEFYGYRDFNDQPGHFQLVRWLYVRSWLTAERPSVLFDLATARLANAKILLPGASSLSKLVAQVRERTAKRLWRVLSNAVNDEQITQLEALLVADENRQSNLDRLRRAPVRVSGPSLVSALERLDEIRNIGVGNVDLEHVPESRIQALARYAAATWAPKVTRMPDDRRIATLLAFAHVFEATAMDDVLDVLDMLTTEIAHDAENSRKKERLRTIRDLDAAALKLLEFYVLVSESDAEVVSLETIFSSIEKDDMEEAAKKVKALARPSDEQYQKELIDCYGRVRRFLPKLLKTIDFHATPAGESVSEALEFLRSIEGKTRPDMSEAPLAVVTKGWRNVVLDDNKVDRRAYTLCVLERLQDTLRRRDIYVTPSNRWGDPRAKLIPASNWGKVKPQVCKSLGRCNAANEELDALAKSLGEAYRRTAENLPNNASVRVDNSDGRDSLTVSNLDMLEEPDSLIELRNQVSDLLPRVDLPQIILEINLQTGFLDEFTHISEGESRASDLTTSLCAALVSESCNIGIEPLARQDVPAGCDLRVARNPAS